MSCVYGNKFSLNNSFRPCTLRPLFLLYKQFYKLGVNPNSQVILQKTHSRKNDVYKEGKRKDFLMKSIR